MNNNHNYPPCYRCGYCCLTRPCTYGHISSRTKHCVYLETADFSIPTYSCKLRSTIIKNERHKKYKMFDNYCSSTLCNTHRDNVIEKLNERKNVMITTITTTLQQERFCKNSVVFKPVQPDNTIPNMDFIRTIYLMNVAYEALGRPSMIELTIKVCDD